MRDNSSARTGPGPHRFGQSSEQPAASRPASLVGFALSLRLQLTLALVALVLASTIILGWLAYGTSSQILERDILRVSQIVANARRQALLRVLGRHQTRAADALRTISLVCRGRSGRNTACAAEILGEFMAAEGATAAVYDRTGAPPILIGEGNTAQALDSLPVPPKGQMARFLADERGRFFYVTRAESDDRRSGITLRFRTQEIDRILLDPFGVGSSGEILLVDSAGYPITPVRYPAAVGQSGPIRNAALDSCLSGHDGQMVAPDYRGTPSIHGFRFFQEIGGGCVLASLDQSEAYAPAAQLKSRVIVASGLFAGLAIVISLLTVRQLSRPIERLTQRAHDLEEGDFDSTVPVEGPAEIRTFARTFNAMAVSLKESRASLIQSEERIRSVLETTLDAVVGINQEGRITFWNTQAAAIFGWSKEEAVDRKMTETILPATEAKAHEDGFRRFLATGTGALVNRRIETRAVRKDGGEFPIEITVTPVKAGNSYVFYGFISDISERKEAETAIRKMTVELEQRVVERTAQLESAIEELGNEVTVRKSAEEGLKQTLSLLSATLESTADGILVVDQHGKITSFNQKFTQMWHIPEAVISSRDNSKTRAFVLDQVKDPQQFLKKAESLHQDHEGESYDLIEFRDGRIFERYSKPQRIAGVSVGRVLSFRDITERKKAAEALEDQAMHDILTGLYNRRYFNHRIQEEMVEAKRERCTLAILMCDLDQFKSINDTQGHQKGDEILKAVAKSIQESTRGTDLVFRWGGDEIVIVLPRATRQGVTVTATRIRKAIRRISKNLHPSLDLSIGVSLYPEHGSKVDELIQQADRALYIAKKGGDKVHIGDEEYHLSENSIKVVFQSIVDVQTGKPIGYETLSRDPQERVSILELFQRYGMIGQLDELKRICFKSQLKKAEEIGLRRVFINVDSAVLQQLEPPAKPVGPEVILEVSEVEALHDVENHLKTAQKWRNQGYKFAIDDFGAGFISLPYVARLMPDYIKVDRSAVLQAVSSAKFRKFLTDLIFALKNFENTGIIAEGIETEKELTVVKELGIHLVQGFLFGRPQELAGRPPDP